LSVTPLVLLSATDDDASKATEVGVGVGIGGGMWGPVM